MDFLDIHSHILPNIDDGAADVKTSVTLLEMMKRQGITHVIATPHFNPMRDSIEHFNANVKSSVAELAHEVRDGDYPTIHLGCELYYFKGMGKSDSLGNFRLANVPYLLLELPYNTQINDSMIRDIEAIYDNSGLMPILAHIERYSSVQGFKKALGLIENGGALAHINAGAVLSKEKIKVCEKLIKAGYITYVASDSHSPDARPPRVKEALSLIGERMGKSVADRLVRNGQRLLLEIESKYDK